MPEFTTFLPPELADIGLMALADPSLAERLIEALRGLPAGDQTGGALLAASASASPSRACVEP
jgi:hypothetical protein